MPKALCKWNKSDRDKAFTAYCEAIRNPRYVCRKCGRAAAAKKALCKPVAL